MEIKTLTSKAGKAKVEIRDNRRQQRLFWKKGSFYEAHMLNHIWKTYKGGLFIDCGACIGNHTVFFAKFCADEVIAIEPVPANVAHIKRNLLLNKLTNVAVIEAAISDYNGRGALESFGPGEGHQKLVEGDTTRVITLDWLDAKDVRLIKLDVEWSEPFAIAGAYDILRNQSPAVFVEANKPNEQKNIKGLLAKFGYKHIGTWNASPTLEFVK